MTSTMKEMSKIRTWETVIQVSQEAHWMHMAFGVRSSLEVTLQIFRCEPLDNRFTPQISHDDASDDCRRAGT